MITLKYALIQILYCSFLCINVGYAAVYLLENNFSNTVIGMTLALGSIIGILMQQFIAKLVDKRRFGFDASKVVYLGFVVMILNSLFLNITNASQLLFLPSFGLNLICINILLPFINSLVFESREAESINFGLARGMGSVSYGLTSLLAGWLVSKHGSLWIPKALVIIVILSLISVTIFKKSVTRKDASISVSSEQNSKSSNNFFVKYPLLSAACFAVVLVFFGFSTTNNYLVHIVNHVKADPSSMGIALFLAACIELPAMMLNKKLEAKFGKYRLIQFSSIFFIVKHVILIQASSIIGVYVSQLMQVFSYAIFLPTSIYLMNSDVNEEDSAQGQALMTGSVSLGGVLASLISGRLIDRLGLMDTLVIATTVSAIGSIALVVIMQQIIRLKKS